MKKYFKKNEIWAFLKPLKSTNKSKIYYKEMRINFDLLRISIAFLNIAVAIIPAVGSWVYSTINLPTRINSRQT